MAQRSGLRKRKTLLDSMIVLSASSKRRRTLGIASFNAPARVRIQNARKAPDVRNLPESVQGHDPFSSEIALACFGSGTMASLAIARTDAVVIPRDLDSGPVPVRQRTNYSTDDRRLTDVSSVPADHNEHLFLPPPFGKAGQRCQLLQILPERPGRSAPNRLAGAHNFGG